MSALGGAVLLAVLGALVGGPGTGQAAGATTVELTSPHARSFFAASRLGTQKTREGRRVVGVVALTATGGGLFCGNCDDEFGFYTVRMGGRLHARLLRLPTSCPTEPGRRGTWLIGSKARPFVDVPSGRYRVIGRIPATRLTRGKWRLCAWFEFDPAFATSTPVFPDSLPGFTVPHRFVGPFVSPRAVRLP